MKLNQDKCHLLVSGYKHENVWAQIGDEKIWESNKQKLLGLQIDRNLHFNEYVSLLCKKAGKKLSVLARLSNFMSIKQRRVLMKSFIESQFGYCPLIWMFHGRVLSNKINGYYYTVHPPLPSSVQLHPVHPPPPSSFQPPPSSFLPPPISCNTLNNIT